MVKRNDSEPEFRDDGERASFLRERGDRMPRQRSARNDRSMRDGDGSHGNPYESDTEDDEFSADNDIGDTENAAAEEATSGAGIDGYEILDDSPAYLDDTIAGTSRTGEVPPTTGDEDEDEAVAAAEYEDPGDPRLEPPPPQTAQLTEDRTSNETLPIPDYERLPVNAILTKLRDLSREDITSLRDYEATHRNRKSLIARLESRLRPRGSGRNSGTNQGSKS